MDYNGKIIGKSCINKMYFFKIIIFRMSTYLRSSFRSSFNHVIYDKIQKKYTIEVCF